MAPDLGLMHAHGAIFHVEHDGHVSVAGILLRPLRDRLLEEAVEAQDLRMFNSRAAAPLCL